MQAQLSALSYYSIGVTQHSLGDYKSALASQQRALNIRLKLFGEEHASTADSYYGLGASFKILWAILNCNWP